MKKKVTITAVVIICILLVVAVALSANRAGGEIGFEATINSVENGVAYATIKSHWVIPQAGVIHKSEHMKPPFDDDFAC